VDLFVEDNPNCAGPGHIVFDELEAPRPVRGIMASGPDGDVACDVTGVNEKGHFIQAHARKISDSGEGVAFLIYGGPWGIRLRPENHREEPWDLENAHQWGEPYKIYGREEDILFASPQP